MNCWIFHRITQPGYKISVMFGRKQIIKHVGLVSSTQAKTVKNCADITLELDHIITWLSLAVCLYIQLMLITTANLLLLLPCMEPGNNKNRAFFILRPEVIRGNLMWLIFCLF